MFTSKKTVFLIILIILTALAAIFIEQKVHHFAGTLVGHSIGILGSFFILIIFLYPIRKYFIKIGNMKEWIDWHMFFGITGPLLVLIHGAFHFHALAATVAAVVMFVSMVSGIIGGLFYIDARKALMKKEEELKKAGVSADERDQMLVTEATSIEMLGKWRLVHYPIAATFLALMMYHIVSVLYYKGI